MHISEKIRRILLPVLLALLLGTSVSAAECPHEYVEMREEPGCESGGLVWEECLLCGDTRNYRQLSPVGHRYGEWVILEGPTCTRDGVQVRECSVCGASDTAKLVRLGHDYVVTVVEPTCTARGKTVHQCSRCGDRFISDEVPPLGHRYDDGIVMSEPTENTKGRILFTCIGCGDTYQLYYPMLPYVDVEKNTFYYTSVLWALSNEITTGIDETHFAPDQVCTRSQVVTFLWRAAGKPEPNTSSNPFRDVPRGSYYEQAVLWAFGRGITTGTDASHFSPDAPCTRGQVVTFLHRLHDCPEPTAEAAFPDVTPEDYCYKAVLWASGKDITRGMDGGYFRPELSCTRAQIVTFLHRDAKNS